MDIVSLINYISDNDDNLTLKQEVELFVNADFSNLKSANISLIKSSKLFKQIIEFVSVYSENNNFENISSQIINEFPLFDSETISLLKSGLFYNFPLYYFVDINTTFNMLLLTLLYSYSPFDDVKAAVSHRINSLPTDNSFFEYLESLDNEKLQEIIYFMPKSDKLIYSIMINKNIVDKLDSLDSLLSSINEDALKERLLDIDYINNKISYLNDIIINISDEEIRYRLIRKFPNKIDNLFYDDGFNNTIIDYLSEEHIFMLLTDIEFCNKYINNPTDIFNRINSSSFRKQIIDIYISNNMSTFLESIFKFCLSSEEKIKYINENNYLYIFGNSKILDSISSEEIFNIVCMLQHDIRLKVLVGSNVVLSKLTLDQIVDIIMISPEDIFVLLQNISFMSRIQGLNNELFKKMPSYLQKEVFKNREFVDFLKRNNSFYNNLLVLDEQSLISVLGFENINNDIDGYFVNQLFSRLSDQNKLIAVFEFFYVNNKQLLKNATSCSLFSDSVFVKRIINDDELLKIWDYKELGKFLSNLTISDIIEFLSNHNLDDGQFNNQSVEIINTNIKCSSDDLYILFEYLINSPKYSKCISLLSFLSFSFDNEKIKKVLMNANYVSKLGNNILEYMLCNVLSNDETIHCLSFTHNLNMLIYNNSISNVINSFNNNLKLENVSNKDEFISVINQMIPHIRDARYNLYLKLLISSREERIRLLNEKFNDLSLVQSFCDLIDDNSRSLKSILFIDDVKGFKSCVKYGNVLSIETNELLNLISDEMVEKSNRKQIKNISTKLAGYVNNNDLLKVSLNMYTLFGYQRSIEILDGKYGDVLKIVEWISKLYPNINVEFNNNQPVLCEQLLTMLFGKEYKDVDTPLKNMISDCQIRKNELEKKKNEINNSSLSLEQKNEKIRHLDEQYRKYVDAINYVFNNFNYILEHFDEILEEYYKAYNKNALDIKLNVVTLKEMTQKIMNLSNEYSYEIEDEPLLNSDVFEYVGVDNQYVSDPSTVRDRAIYLSRAMASVKTKKFPNISIEKGDLTIYTYSPQDRRILCAGARSRCCFRPNGNADNHGNDNSLLRYCTSTEYGGGVEIKNSDGKTLMFSPVLRNGNVLMIHSIETAESNLTDEAHELLVEYAKKVIDESDGKIDFVCITDLHYLKTRYTSASLPTKNKFHVYDPDNKFNGMYHNLSSNHMVLAKRLGKNFDDIEYDYEVESYDYPKDDHMMYSSFSSFDLNLIKLINEYDSKISELSNYLLSVVDINEAYNVKKNIIDLKKIRLSYYKQLLDGHKEKKKQGVDVYDKYNKVFRQVRKIDDNGCLNTRFTGEIVEIYYGCNWYILKCSDGLWYANYIAGYENDFNNQYNNLVSLIPGFSIQNSIGGNYETDRQNQMV